MTQRELILRALEGEPMQRGDIAEECGIEPNGLSTVLNLLKQDGLIIRVPEGWTLASKVQRRHRADGASAEPKEAAPAAQPSDPQTPSAFEMAFPPSRSTGAPSRLLFAISESGDLLIDRVDGSGACAVIERDEVCRLAQFLQRCAALLEAA